MKSSYRLRGIGIFMKFVLVLILKTHFFKRIELLKFSIKKYK